MRIQLCLETDPMAFNFLFRNPKSRKLATEASSKSIGTEKLELATVTNQLATAPPLGPYARSAATRSYARTPPCCELLAAAAACSSLLSAARLACPADHRRQIWGLLSVPEAAREETGDNSEGGVSWARKIPGPGLVCRPERVRAWSASLG